MENKELILDLIEKFFPEIASYIEDGSDSPNDFYYQIGDKLIDLAIRASYKRLGE